MTDKKVKEKSKTAAYCFLTEQKKRTLQKLSEVTNSCSSIQNNYLLGWIENTVTTS
ncbi:MAG: hypothetical protein UIK37_07405 [Lachnospiraceae bacterium]|jgi:hypothetical protein|nr:hypothetical protein [Lachnospiraceae bacterium]